VMNVVFIFPYRDGSDAGPSVTEGIKFTLKFKRLQSNHFQIN
jgi:hypothetical protein